MRPLRFLAPMAVVLVLTACSGGNLKTASDYSAPSAPPVRYPTYNPYSTYGTVQCDVGAARSQPARDRRAAE